MAEAKHDGNHVPTLIGVSSVDGTTPTLAAVNPVTGRVLVDTGGGGTGTVTSVASADGSITVTNPTTTVDLAVVKAPKWSTARNLAGNSVDGSANVAFANKFIVQGTTDAGLSAAQFLGALGTGIVKNTTTTGVLSIAVAGDFPTLNQSTTGSAATLTTARTIGTATGDVTSAGSTFDGSANNTNALTLATVNTNTGGWGSATQVGTFTVNGKGLITAAGNTTVTPAVGSITGLGTGVATALGVNIGSAGAFVTTSSSDTLTNKTLTTPVINGTITGTGQATAATASTITMRDANGNTSMNNLLEGYATTATAAGTTTLTVSSVYQQYFTGVTTQIVALPVASTLVNGQSWYIINNSTGLVTINTSGGNQLGILAGSTQAIVTCINTAGGTGTASWNIWYEADTITAGKKLSVSNTLTLAGTDGQTMTFPATSATIAGLGTSQTFTGQDKFNNIIDVNNAVTVSTNAGTVPVTFRLNTFTNSSAATMAITMATASAVDGQMTIVRIYDFSAVAQTIGWTNTENSTVSVPTTSNGSTTLPLTVGFMYNSATSKWRCIASA